MLAYLLEPPVLSCDVRRLLQIQAPLWHESRTHHWSSDPWQLLSQSHNVLLRV